MIGYLLRAVSGKSALRKALQKHFEGVQLGEIVTAAREFPIISRVDVQMALDQIFQNRPGSKLLGIHAQMDMKLRPWRICSPPGPFQWTLARCSTTKLT